jgi:flavin reductase (DIM6/NTAB) family NADH-FMN oxidoreductase RutF
VQKARTRRPTDDLAYRRLARAWAASVTVVTVRRDDARVAEDRPPRDGFTATAFLTVSIDPPIVLVSASNATSAFAMLQDSAHFAVNLLAVSQREVADAFARPYADRSAVCVPILTDALGAFSARVRQVVAAGDHTLVLGDVTALHIGADTTPLVYHNRSYGRVAPHE